MQNLTVSAEENSSQSCRCDLMVEMSEPAHLTDMAVDIGIQSGEWGAGKSSVSLIIESNIVTREA